MIGETDSFSIVGGGVCGGNGHRSGACSRRATRITRWGGCWSGSRRSWTFTRSFFGLDRGGSEPGEGEVEARPCGARVRGGSAVRDPEAAVAVGLPGPGVRAPGLGVGAALRAGRSSAAAEEVGASEVGRVGARGGVGADQSRATGGGSRRAGGDGPQGADRRHGDGDAHPEARGQPASSRRGAGSDAAAEARPEAAGAGGVPAPRPQPGGEAPVPGGVERAGGRLARSATAGCWRSSGRRFATEEECGEPWAAAWRAEVEHYRDLVARVIDQTERRVLEGRRCRRRRRW